MIKIKVNRFWIINLLVIRYSLLHCNLLQRCSPPRPPLGSQVIKKKMCKRVSKWMNEYCTVSLTVVQVLHLMWQFACWWALVHRRKLWWDLMARTGLAGARVTVGGKNSSGWANLRARVGRSPVLQELYGEGCRGWQKVSVKEIIKRADRSSDVTKDLASRWHPRSIGRPQDPASHP